MSTVIPEVVLSAWDRPGQRRFAFHPDRPDPPAPRPNVMSQMISRNIEIPYFNLSNVPPRKNVVLASYAIGRCEEEGWDVSSYSRFLAAAEIVEPYLPAHCFAEEKASRKLFVRGCLKSLGGRYSNSLIQASGFVDFANYPHEIQEIQTIIRRFPTENNFNDNVDATIQVLVGSIGPVVDATYTDILAEAVAQIMDIFCAYLTIEGRAASTAMYTIMYLGLTKRGTISLNKLEEMNSQISLETNLDVQIKVSEIQNCLMLGIKSSAKEILERLQQNISRFSTELEIIMQHAARSRLADYWTIRVGFSWYPDFPWDEASKIIAEDFNQFIAAYKIVQDNKYYHFQGNRSAVSHKYATLGWLATQLLIKNNPEQFKALKEIRVDRGTTGSNTPTQRAHLQQLIDKYDPAVKSENFVNLNSMIEAYKISENNREINQQ